MGSSGPVLCENQFLISVWYGGLVVHPSQLIEKCCALHACFSCRLLMWWPVRANYAAKHCSCFCSCFAHPHEHDLPLRFKRRLPVNGLHLKLHLMRLVTCSQAEVAGEIAAEELLFLDCRQQCLVDRLLVCRTGRGGLLLLWGFVSDRPRSS